MKTPEIKKNYFHTSDNERLPTRIWKSENDSEVIVIGIHGYSDYSNSFSTPASLLKKFKIDFYAFDLRGFGSNKNKGYWYPLKEHILDIKEFYQVLKKKNPEKKIYLLGESMGGALAISAIKKYKIDVDGVILISPAIWNFSNSNFIKSKFLWLLTKIYPGMILKGEKFVTVRPSNNVKMLKEFSRDPLVVHKKRADSLLGMVELMDQTYNDCKTLLLNSNIKVLFIIPLIDEIIPRKPLLRLLKIKDIRKKINDGDIKLAVYENNFHMILRDKNGEKITSDIKDWIFDPESLNSLHSTKDPIKKLEESEFFHILD